MKKWICLTLITLTIEGTLLLLVAYILLWKSEFLGLHHTAAGVVCAVAGVGLLMPAVIGMMSGLLSKVGRPDEK